MFHLYCLLIVTVLPLWKDQYASTRREGQYASTLREDQYASTLREDQYAPTLRDDQYASTLREDQYATTLRDRASNHIIQLFFSLTALTWFSSSLTDRFQSVLIEGNYSSDFNLMYGAPQCSVLGPVLFTIYVCATFRQHFKIS